MAVVVFLDAIGDDAAIVEINAISRSNAQA
jgi:hypothetical protein